MCLKEDLEKMQSHLDFLFSGGSLEELKQKLLDSKYGSDNKSVYKTPPPDNDFD